jgi:predicted glycosyltransferase involved in capsule biosynthesis
VNRFVAEDYSHLVVTVNQDHDVYIGRGSKWGNPFMIGKDGTREEVIKKFKDYLLSNTKLMEDLEELRGKTLGCFCSPKPCHGHVLAVMANKGVTV